MRLKGLTMLVLGWGIGVFAQEIPATKVTLSLKDVPLADAVKQIAAASGNLTTAQIPESGGMSLMRTIGLAPQNRVTLEVKDKPYWSVIEELCEKNKLRMMEALYNTEPQVCLIQGGPEKLPTSTSGACMLRIVETRIDKINNFRAEPQRSIVLNLKLNCEPRSGVFKCAREPAIEQAVTDQGDSLARGANGDPTFEDFNEHISHRFELKLNYKPGAKSLKTLSGKIWVIQEVKSEDWVIETGKAVGATKTVCDIDTLKITGLKLDNNFIHMEMDISSGTRNENLMSWDQIVRRMRYEGLENQGKMMSYMNGASGRTEGGKTISACKFMTQSDTGLRQMPPKLVIRVPTEVKAFQIPFEFHDVEMP